MHDADLRREPRLAGSDLGRSRFFVYPTFSAGLPLEVFDDVRDVRLLTVYAGLAEGFIEKPARGSDERMPGKVFLIARLLADEHNGRRTNAALSKNRLRRVLVQVAAHASGRGCFQSCIDDFVRKVIERDTFQYGRHMISPAFERS